MDCARNGNRWAGVGLAVLCLCVLSACGGGGLDLAALPGVDQGGGAPAAVADPLPPATESQLGGAAAGPAPAIGVATLSWTPPTTREDGSALVDLAGYKIYYGTQSGNYTEVVDVPTAGVTEYMIEGLAPGTYYFVVTAYDTAGNESPPSNEATKTVA